VADPARALPKLAIVGSCVSRDLLTHQPHAEQLFQLGHYVSRATMISMASGPSAELVALLGAESTKTFDDRRFHHDVQKNYFELLRRSAPDVVVIDLIDERHASFCLDDGPAIAYTALSKQFLHKHGWLRRGTVVTPLTDAWVERQAAATAAVAARLRATLPHARFLIHEAPYATHQRAPDGVRPFDDQPKIARWNDYLEQAYAELRSALGAERLAVDRERVRGGGEHLWDLTPFHYDRSYYVDLAGQLERALGRLPPDSPVAV
jgi:hypothetical protein